MLHLPTQAELDRLGQEAEQLLVGSIINPEQHRRDTDPRHNLTGFLNPNNCSYRLPRSRGEYKDIVDLLNHKPYQAYYPQSFVDIPQYFVESGLDPFFQTRPLDDYARGVATIAQMISMTVNNVRWCLMRDEDLPEILRYATNYREEFNRPNLTAVMSQYAKHLDIFIQELEVGMQRLAMRQSNRKYRDTPEQAPSTVNLAVILQKVLGR